MDDEPALSGGSHELFVMAAKVWIDPSVIGSVFNVDDQPFTVWESLRRVSLATLCAALRRFLSTAEHATVRREHAISTSTILTG